MIAALLTVLLSAQALFAAADYTPEALADEVKNLPGAENLQLNFRQFSGYLPITSTKNMHYWFVESSRDPANDPIAFWTNGGPGCSGLLGFLTEQGPFRPNKDMSLNLNPYSWNTVANMVFIEQPCGVGFSYSSAEDTKSDYQHSDDSAAADNYQLIQQFLTRFPQYRANSLYITSESYGGHYMPSLAKEIVDMNAKGGNEKINFKGFAVGNPATTFYSAIPAGLDTYWGHQLVSKPMWDSYQENCVNAKPTNFTMCETYFMAMYLEVSGLNPYALDYPVCLEDGPLKYGRSQRNWMLNHHLGAMRAHYGDFADHHEAKLRETLKLQPVDGYEPCEDDYMTTYLNLDSVKQAIHVKQDITWVDCSRSIRYDQFDGAKSMTPYYNYLIDGNFGLDILVYSGDDDDVCATIGTQSWIWDLGYQVTGKPWQVYKVNEQVGGYLTKWSRAKLAFATVHGAGHEVPTYKPDVALYLFDAYLKGELTN